jgi:anti-anti-sigma factor
MPPKADRKTRMFEVIRGTETTIVNVRGEIDMSTCAPLKTTLGNPSLADAHRVVVSLVECTYMDSTCIAVLVAAQNALRNRLRIVIRPGSAPARILRVAGLLTFFTCVEAFDDTLGESA